MIKSNFNSITTSDREKHDITPLVKSLSGRMKLPINFNLKEEIRNYLREKYQ